MWRRLFPAAVLLVGLTELALHAYYATAAPEFDDYAVVEEAVSALKQPDDLIVVAPRWAEPVARRALGDRLMPVRDVARADDRTYPAAIEVSLLGERATQLESWREVGRVEVGKFVVRRLENPAPVAVAVDFVEQLETAKVWRQDEVLRESGQRPCRFTTVGALSAGGLGGHPAFPRRRFQCPGGSYFFVGVTVIADNDFRPRRCIWAHPPTQGAVSIAFDDVPLGEIIEGHGGIHWMAERERRGAPVELTVYVDGDEIGRWVHVDGDGWAPFAFPVGKHAGQHASVRFEVSSPDAAGRQFCFAPRGTGVAR